jgi:hypothetical protein
LVFAAPGFFLFWLIMLAMISNEFYGRRLFRAALSTGFILSGATAYFSLNLLSDTKVLLIPIFIILSAITSIMMHFNLFKKIRRDKVKENFQIENYNHST